jgi:hypothetical protein
MERVTFSYFVLAIVFALLAITNNWVNKARPDPSVWRQYSKLVLLRVMFSFTTSWMRRIKNEHIPLFLKYRSRMNMLAIIYVVSCVFVFPILFLWVSRMI